MNLLDAAERISDLGSSRVRYRPERCLHTMLRGAECEACWICPTEAISETQPPLFDLSKCTQCLACLPACPTGAFSGKDHLKGILRTIHRLDAHSIELLCHLHPTPETGPISGAAICAGACLASLGSSTYLSMAAIGVETLHLRTDACGDCPFGELIPHMEQQYQQAQRLLNSRAPESIQIIPVELSGQDEFEARQVWQAENPPLSRRDLFKMASGLGGQFLSEMIDVEEKKGKLGAERVRQNHALRQLFSADKVDATATLEGFDYALLTVDERCTACGTCAKVCPTDALVLEIDEEHFRLNFSAEECIACELCRTSCTPEAITLTRNPMIKHIFQDEEPGPLIDGDLIQCIRCGAHIAEWTASRMCPVCEFRSLHPFGSFIPPSVRKTLKPGSAPNQQSDER